MNINVELSVKELNNFIITGLRQQGYIVDEDQIEFDFEYDEDFKRGILKGCTISNVVLSNPINSEHTIRKSKLDLFTPKSTKNDKTKEK